MPTALTIGTHGIESHENVARARFFPVANAENADLSYASKKMADGVDTFCYVTFRVPSDFVSLTSIHAVIIPKGTGNMKWAHKVYFAANGEIRATHDVTGADVITAVTSDDMIELDDFSGASGMANLAKGDYVGVRIGRDGDHVNDTVGADVHFLGIVFKYTAEQ